MSKVGCSIGFSFFTPRGHVSNIRPIGRADGHKVHPYSCTGILGVTCKGGVKSHTSFYCQIERYNNYLMPSRHLEAPMPFW